MHIRSTLVLFSLVAWVDASAASPSPQQKVSSAIAAVTVYSDRAMVSRTAKATLEPGLHRVSLTGLPTLLEDPSVRVSAIGTAEARILEVKVERTFFDTIATARVKPLLLRSRELNLEKRRLNDRVTVLKHQTEFLNKIGIASQESIARELRSQRFSVLEYKQLLNFFDTELTATNAEIRRIEDRLVEIGQAYVTAQREIREIGGTPDRSEKQISVLFEVLRAGALDITASYLIGQAGWTPVYDIRVATSDSIVHLTYSASVHQNTGEDWKDVRMSLTTARPSLGGSVPEPLPWYVGLLEHATGAIEGIVRDRETGEPLPGAQVTVVGRNVTAVTDVNGAYRISGLPAGGHDLRATFVGYTGVRMTTLVRPFATSKTDFGLPAAAMETSEVVVTGERPIVERHSTNAVRLSGAAESDKPTVAPVPIRAEEPTATVTATIAAASFEVPGRTSIPSDNAQHRIGIMVSPLKGEFSYRCVPKLQSDVFLTATLRNETDYPILAGPVNVFLDNSFVNSAKLPAVFPGDTFNASLGVDNAVSVERRLLNRVTEVSGVFSKTRKVRYTIAFKVENKKREAHTLSVFEGIPVSQDEKVKVMIEVPKAEENVPDANGIFTWHFRLAPGERREFRLQYVVESPTELNVGGLD